MREGGKAEQKIYKITVGEEKNRKINNVKCLNGEAK